MLLLSGVLPSFLSSESPLPSLLLTVSQYQVLTSYLGESCCSPASRRPPLFLKPPHLFAYALHSVMMQVRFIACFVPL